MPSTLTIPLTTLTVGAHTFGPTTPPSADTSVVLSIDRAVTGGLNSLTTASGLAMLAEMSTDGGTTWQAVDTDQSGTQTEWETVGGGTSAVSNGGWPLFPGASRRVRATVTVSGPSSIAVAGSIATQ